MQDLSLHILDIAENSIASGAKNIQIKIIENIEEDSLVLEIQDDGEGMDQVLLSKATDPFVTTRESKNVGLGLALLSQAAAMANGELRIESALGKGTLVTARFQHSHIDRKPLGNLRETLTTLICANPGIDFCYLHKGPNYEIKLSTKEIKKQIGEDTLSYIDAAREVRRKLSY